MCRNLHMRSYSLCGLHRCARKVLETLGLFEGFRVQLLPHVPAIIDAISLVALHYALRLCMYTLGRGTEETQ